MGIGSGLPVLRLVLAGLAVPHPTHCPSTRDQATTSIVGMLPQEAAIRLPSEDVSYRLIETYFEHCDFFSPIFYKASVLRSLDDASDVSKTQERYKIFMILAVAVQLLSRTDSSVPASRADAFFSTASDILLTHTTELLTGDLSHLEVLLVMIQFMSFSSQPAGTWHTIGLATRLSIDLGLHDEPSSLQLDNHSLDRRRRLFWATYTFERNLCAVLGRPVSIPDEAISAPLPSCVEGCITEQGVSPSSRPSRLALAVHLIKFRRLESEIMQVLHQSPPLFSKTFDHCSWRDDMRKRLYEWRATLPPHQTKSQLAPLEIFDGCLHNSLLQLYSPSRHLPRLASDDCLFLASCAQRSIEAYRSSFRDGKLRFYWRTIHNLFRSGVALIHCLKNWPQERAIDLDSIHMSLNSCSSILWGMVERYPAGRPCRDIFETLHDSTRGWNPHQLSVMQTQPGASDAVLVFPAAGQYDLPQTFGGATNGPSLQDFNMQEFVMWDI
jgi:hypothetical protein